MQELFMTTLRDISKATSLSLSTVSAVLGGRAEKLAISKKTIEKVLACAEELDYHPDLSARTLRSSESKIIGLLMPNIKVEFWQNMILDLQKEYQVPCRVLLLLPLYPSVLLFSIISSAKAR